MYHCPFQNVFLTKSQFIAKLGKKKQKQKTKKKKTKKKTDFKGTNNSKNNKPVALYAEGVLVVAPPNAQIYASEGENFNSLK